MVLGQNLKRGGVGKALGKQKANSSGELVGLRRGPPMDVLQESRQSRFFKWSLKILVSDYK